MFKLSSKFNPTGDQPQAIEKLAKGLKKGKKHQVLLGVTGSGKTFTMAKVIEQYQRPTLVISHNKTLAAQLYKEFKEFFPKNAVHYFVSYYDYYQPEAYIPSSDTYIEKDASINEEIAKYRHAATMNLLTRRDVLIVASVSCIYGLGDVTDYEALAIKLERGQKMQQIAKIDAKAFLRNTVSTKVRSELPSAVRAQIESKVVVTGKMEVLHIDDFSNTHNSRFDYHVRAGGKRSLSTLQEKHPRSHPVPRCASTDISWVRPS